MKHGKTAPAAPARVSKPPLAATNPPVPQLNALLSKHPPISLNTFFNFLPLLANVVLK